MKQSPQLLYPEDIKNWKNTTHIDDLWWDVRPLSRGSFFDRIVLAWGIFLGKYDALEWYKQ